MNYRITGIGFNKFAMTLEESKEIAQSFCDKQSFYARKGYPVKLDIFYNSTLIETVSVDGKC